MTRLGKLATAAWRGPGHAILDVSLEPIQGPHWFGAPWAFHPRRVRSPWPALEGLFVDGDTAEAWSSMATSSTPTLVPDGPQEPRRLDGGRTAIFLGQARGTTLARVLGAWPNVVEAMAFALEESGLSAVVLFEGSGPLPFDVSPRLQSLTLSADARVVAILARSAALSGDLHASAVLARASRLGRGRLGGFILHGPADDGPRWTEVQRAVGGRRRRRLLESRYPWAHQDWPHNHGFVVEGQRIAVHVPRTLHALAERVFFTGQEAPRGVSRSIPCLALRPATPPVRSLRVLILTWVLARGGAERWLVELLKGLRQADIHTVTVACDPGRHELGGEALATTDEVWPLGDLVDGGSLPDAFLRVAERRREELFYCASTYLLPRVLPQLRARRPDLRTVLHIHCAEDIDGPRLQRVDPFVDRYVALSPSLAQSLVREGVAEERIDIRPLGIDVGRFEHAPKRRTGQPLRVLSVGRAVDQKDPLLLCAVARELVQRGVRDITFTLVGDGPLLPEVRAYVATHGLSSVVALPGSVPSDPHYRRADVLLLTSRYEGVPLVLFEAWAAGLPVVMSVERTGVEGLLLHEHNGLVVPRRSPATYADALLRLRDDEDLRLRMGTAAFHERNRFDIDDARKAFVDLFHQVARQTLGAPSPSASSPAPAGITSLRPDDLTVLLPWVHPRLDARASALEAVFAQSDPRWRLIFLLPGDTPPSEVLAQTRHPRIGWVAAPSLVVAAGRAVRAMATDFVLLLSPDHLLALDAVESLRAGIASEPTFNAFFNQQREADEGGVLLGPPRPLRWEATASDLREEPLAECPLAVRSTTLRDLGGLNEALPYRTAVHRDLPWRLVQSGSPLRGLMTCGSLLRATPPAVRAQVPDAFLIQDDGPPRRNDARR